MLCCQTPYTRELIQNENNSNYFFFGFLNHHYVSLRIFSFHGSSAALRLNAGKAEFAFAILFFDMLQAGIWDGNGKVWGGCQTKLPNVWYIINIYVIIRTNYILFKYICFWFMMLYSLLLFCSIRTLIIHFIYYLCLYTLYIYRCLLTYTGLLIWLGLMPFLCLSVVEDSQFVCSWLAWLLELHTWISSRLQTLTSPRFSCRSLWLQRYGNNFVRIGEIWWCLGTRFCHHTIDFQNLENLVNELGQGKQAHLVQGTQCTGYIYIFMSTGILLLHQLLFWKLQFRHSGYFLTRSAGAGFPPIINLLGGQYALGLFAWFTLSPKP